MAIRKTVNLLPAQFRTDLNKKFLNATLDQLMSPGTLDVVNGFVGKRDVDNFKKTDSYVVETTSDRRNYQFEPAITIKKDIATSNLDQSAYSFASTYIDTINAIKFRGGNGYNHNKLFSSEYYVWAPPIDLDKISSYTKYYWLQDGPDVVEINEEINLNSDVIGKTNFTTAGGVKFSSGLKVKFTHVGIDPTTYYNKVYLVANVGNSIELIEWDNLVTPESGVYSLGKDYITIKPGSIDGNQWSNNNRWFHEDIIAKTAEYNKTVPVFDSALRARRPIIEFDKDLKLYDFGSVKLTDVDLVDTYFTDAFSDLEGKPSTGTYVDGILVTNGLKIVFTKDEDTFVDGHVYEVEIVTIGGVDTIHLEKSTTIPTPLEGNTIVATQGANKGTQWYYKNGKWEKGQVKTGLNQAPLFDMFDDTGNSFSTYTNSTFAGSKVFSYAVNSAGVADAELGFGLTYRNFNNIGDIVFHDNIIRDSFTYTSDVLNNVSTSTRLATGYLHNTSSLVDHSVLTNWTKAPFESRQFIQQTISVGGEVKQFKITTTPKTETLAKNLIVTVNGKLQEKGLNSSTTKDYYILESDGIQYVNFTRDLLVDDLLVIKSLTDDSIENLVDGEVYTIPINLSNNPLNSLDESVVHTLGQIREHIGTCVENSLDFEGDYIGNNNIRDIANIAGLGTNIIQNSASLIKAGYILTNNEYDFYASIDHAEAQYLRFKNLFLQTADKLTFNSDTSSFVDTILQTMFAGKTSEMPYFDSDMVPFSSDRTSQTYVVFDVDSKQFELNRTYNDTVPGQTAVLLYHNDTMLLKDRDYTFSITTPFVTLTDNVTLVANDKIKIVEFNTTGNNFIPPTPTKLGLYPKYLPSKYTDNTYITPIDVIQGHDGSITPAYGDYKDDIILELEKRIYNNLKTHYNEKLLKMTDIFTGHTRKTMYSKDEVNQILSEYLSKWSNKYSIDHLINDTYDVSDPFTWNYGNLRNKLNKDEFLPGHWRAIYKYFYDTDRPHTHPWEMLGFYEKPNWWDATYGPAPYTKDNLVLWQDLEDGKIANGATAGTYTEYKRVGLVASYIPTDGAGALLSPRDVGLLDTLNADRSINWKVGDDGPVETAWKRSSSYPFVLQKLFSLLQPAKYFELMFDVSRITTNQIGNYVDKKTGLPIVANDVKTNGFTDTSGIVHYTLGYNNWIVDFIKYLGGSSVTFNNNLNGLNANLAYKMAGFTDKEKLKIILEQVSPTRSSNDIYIPQEDYSFYLLEGKVLQKINYSGVIIEKTDQGYVVDGYSIESPYFNVLPSITTSGNRAQVSVGGVKRDTVPYEIDRRYTVGEVIETVTGVYYIVNAEFTATDDFDVDRANLTRSADIPTDGGVTVIRYDDYSKNTKTVPYKTIFKTIQDTYDFIISYGRYLESVGLSFDNISDEYGEVEDWYQSGIQYLFWTQTNFGEGSMITMSAGANKLTFNLDKAQVGSLISAILPSSIINQNKEKIIVQDLFFNREDNIFELSVNDNTDGIYACSLNPIQSEHLLILENETVFNDIIWNLNTGSRQNRIKLVGYRSKLWDGTRQLPGYVLLDESVDNWNVNNNYELGDIVKFKNKFYAANIKHAPSDLAEAGKFDFSKWKPLEKVESGLLSNLDTKADQFRGFYEIEEDVRKIGTESLSSNLIGYQSRKYLENLQIDETAQKKFYQGFIKEKGTTAVVDKLLRARVPALDTSIDLYEEWAFRVGEYGSVNSSQTIDFYLSENKFTESPGLIEIINSNEQYKNEHVTVRPSDLYQKPLEPIHFNKNIFSIESDTVSDRLTLPTAGYVRTDEAQHILVSLSNWVNNDVIEISGDVNVETEIIGRKSYITDTGISLKTGTIVTFSGTQIIPSSYKGAKYVVSGVGTSIVLTEKNKYMNSLKIGDKVWVANADSYPPKFKEDTKDWAVYRITNTGNSPISISKDAEGEITVSFLYPIGTILEGEYIILRRFYSVNNQALDYSGVYKVKKNLASSGLYVLVLTASTTADPFIDLGDSQAPTLTSGEFLSLSNARYATSTEVNTSNEPRYGWQDGDLVWVDDYDDTGKWAVLEKKNAYTLGKQVYPNGLVTDTGFGQGVATNKDTSTLLVGSVYNDTSAGNIEQWTRDIKTVFDVTSIFVSGDGSLTSGFLSESGYLLKVTSDGLPQPASFGTFPNNYNPNRVTSSDYEHTFRIRVGTNTSTTSPREVGLGGIGILANGVSPVSPLINGNLPNDPGPAKGSAPANYHWNAVYNRELLGFDSGDGHPQEDGHYHYHSGRFLSQWDSGVYTANSYYNDTNYGGDHWRHADGHSKIIGYAYDGYPIYGPFGYQTPDDATTTVVRMKSSYIARATPLANRLYSYSEYGKGAFIEDYYFAEASGSLDKHNGRYCVTPDYPDGTYAYFLTILADGTPVYPYIIGPTFKEYPVLEEDTVPQDPTGSNAQTIKLEPSDFSFSNNVIDGSLVYNSGLLGWQFSTAPDHDYIITSAPGSNNSEGYAYVLKQKDDKTYEPFDVLRSPSPTVSGYFGYDVDISTAGDFIIVGAPGELKAHIYKLATGITSQSEYFSGTGATPSYATSITYASNDEISVYVDGQIKIEGLDYTLGVNTLTFINGYFPASGSNNIEMRRGNYYYLIQTLTGSAATDFGRSVAISDDADYVYVGQPNLLSDGLQQVGSVKIYGKVPSNTYYEIQEIKSNLPFELENFGKQVEAAAKGHTIAIGAPGADYIYVDVTASLSTNTGEVEYYINDSKISGTVIGTVANPTVSIGDQIVINGTQVTFTGTTLASIVQDINDADITLVTAEATTDNKLKITCTRNETNNKLAIAIGDVGEATVFAALGIVPYAYKGTLVHPDGLQNSYYGERIKFNETGTKLLISSPVSNSIVDIALDDGLTTFDKGNTIISDLQLESGSALLYDVNGDSSYSLVQRLDWRSRRKYDRYGAGIALTDVTAFVGAPGDDYFEIEEKLGDGVTTAFTITGQYSTDNIEIFVNNKKLLEGFTSDNASPNSTITFDEAPVAYTIKIYKYTNNTGSVIEASNTNKNNTWKVKHSQPNKVDIDIINKVFTYNQKTNKFIDYIDFLDPVKGKISGIVNQEISFKTYYDPAVYNVATSSSVTADEKNHWGPNEVGTLWWDLTDTKYVDYEQGDLEYRKNMWGKLFPGTEINIYEWVESDTLPSGYLIRNGDGVPKLVDDSAYVEYVRRDTTTQLLQPVYYYWVKNKLSVPQVSQAYVDQQGQIKFTSRGRELELNSFIPAATRKLPAATVASMLENPEESNIPYIGIVSTNAIVAHNLNTGLVNDDIVLSINYDTKKNNIPLHTEWQLVQKNNKLSKPNKYLVTKMADSLVGSDINGRAVPDTTISVGSRYGILNQPRQSMFVDRLSAVKVLVDYCNTVFIKNKMAIEYNLKTIQSAESLPTYGYDETVETYTELTYINTNTISDGYKVIVKRDETRGNYWSTYTWSVFNSTWIFNSIQKYDTTKYWDYKDWYAEGYDSKTSITYTVNTKNDLVKLTTKTGDTVKVLNDGQGKWVLYKKTNPYEIIGQENATIELKSNLYNTNTSLQEIRYIIDALQNELFIGNLEEHFNKVWFELVQYALVDQSLQVDWAFKTSFATVTQTVRELSENINYSYDVQDSIESYIEEAKPYRTNLREYIFRYPYTDISYNAVTDFDLPGYWDETQQIFRSPNVYEADDDNKMQEGPWVNWLNHYTKHVESIIVLDGGRDYSKSDIDEYAESAYDVTLYDGSAIAITPPVIFIESGAQWELGYTYTPDTRPGEAGAQAVLIVPDHSPDTLWYYSSDIKDMGWKVRVQPALPTPETKTFAVTVVVDGEGNPDFYIDGVERPNLILYRGSTYTFTQTDASNAAKGYFRFSAIEDGTHRDGSGATAVPVMDPDNSFDSIKSITVTNPGTGYVTTPKVIIQGGSGSGARAYAQLENYKVRDILETIKFDRVDGPRHVETITVDNGGTGYTSVPTITITGVVSTIAITEKGLGYTSVPNIIISKPDELNGIQATATATLDVDGSINSVIVTEQGSGYINTPFIQIVKSSVSDPNPTKKAKLTATITGQGGNGAQAVAAISSGSITSITVTEQGKGYQTPPTVVITGGGGSNASATATITYTTYNRLEPDHELTSKKHSDRLTLYYSGGQTGTNSDKNWKNEQADIPTYESVISESGIQYKANKVLGAEFSLEPGYDRAAYARNAFDDYAVTEEGIRIIASVDTDLSGGDFSLTAGIDPANVVVDGDGFVTVHTSHAPEEQIPGRTFDTLDLKVYDMPSPRTSGVTVKKYSFYGTGSNSIFTLNDFNAELPTARTGVEVYVDNVIKYVDVDYSLNYRTNSIEFITAIPSVGQLVHIVLVETGGENITTFKQDFIGDGSTTAFIVNIPYQYAQNMYVTLDGLSVTHTATSYYKRTKITLSSAPVFGQRLRVSTFNVSPLTVTNPGSKYDPTNPPTVTFSGGSPTTVAAATAVVNVNGEIEGFIITNPGAGYLGAPPTVTIGAPGAGGVQATATATVWGDTLGIQSYPYVVVSSEAYTLPALAVWPTDYTVSYLAGQFVVGGPEAAKMFVYLNGSRLTPPDTEYYTGDGSTTAYAGPTNPTINYALATDADIQVHVAGELKTLTTDYTFTGAPDARSEVTFVTAPADGEEVAITVRNGQYWIENDRDVILENGSGLSTTAGAVAGDNVFIQGYENQKYSQGRTITIEGQSIATSIGLERFDQFIYDTTGYAGDVSVAIATPVYDIRLMMEEYNTNYAWVWLNGVYQIANHDYFITDDGYLVMTPRTGAILASDKITVTTMRGAEAEQGQGLAFRIWKNMFDQFAYYRIATKNTTELQSEFYHGSQQIFVKDASKLLVPDPTNGIPGVVFIGGERVEYWEIDGNVLKRIRRGTWGTGHSNDVYAVGTEVVDGSRQQVMPGKSDAHYNVWYDQGSSTATNGLGLGLATTPQVKFLKEAPLTTPKAY